jgi:predicted phage tail protein
VTPDKLEAVRVSPSQINLSWHDKSDNEAGFKIEQSGDGRTFTQIATVGANVATYARTGLSASTKYYYRVRAYNSGGDSKYSNIVNTTTLAAPTPTPAPAAPDQLAIAPVSSSQINLSWHDKSNNETGFKIERSGDGKTFTQIATIGANVATYANTNLSASTKYYYRLRAYNSGGDSKYSNIVNKTTLPEPH